MRTNPSPALLFSFSLLISLVLGCASVEKHIEKGDYDKAMEVATRKIAGKDQPHPRYVRALETAFNRVTDEELAQAERMTSRADPDWPNIHVLYDRITRRQDALLPLLPVVDRNGYVAQFRFAEVDALWDETLDSATIQLYDEALALLQNGRDGDRQSARDAYARFGDVENFRENYRQTRALRREAEELGVVNVLLETENRSRAWLPFGFERDLERLQRRVTDTRWRKYDLQARADRDYHYVARIVLRRAEVSNDNQDVERFTEQRTITDGTEPVLDAAGNAVIDTLTGRRLTRPRRVNVSAEVFSYLLYKDALLSADLEIYDADGRLVDRDNAEVTAVFEDNYFDFRGDRRALSQEVRNNLDRGRPRFPDDGELLEDAAEELIPLLIRRLENSNEIY